MAAIKMDKYVQVELVRGSKYYNVGKIVTAGIRNNSFFLNGKLDKIILPSDISGVFVIKDGIYQNISVDAFKALT